VATRRGLIGRGGPLASLALLAVVPGAAHSQQYSLFHRTPRGEERPLATDRPDRTENAHSIPAGWVQLETSVVSWTRNRDADTTTHDVGVAQLNLKVGLLPNVDLQFVTELWSRETVRTADGTLLASTSGQGLFVGRLKVNLWGNDGGRTALAIMPFAGAVREAARPDGQTKRHGLAGVVVPLALDLGRDWSLGAQVELDLAEDGAGTWRSGWVQSATVGHPIVGPLAAYLELFHASGGGDAHVFTGDTGLTLAITGDLQLDAGVNLGLSDGADGVSPFLGLAARF